MKKLIFNVSGSRKKAIARATVREGKGNVVINQQNLATIEPLLSRLRLQGEISFKVFLLRSQYDLEISSDKSDEKLNLEMHWTTSWASDLEILGSSDLPDQI